MDWLASAHPAPASNTVARIATQDFFTASAWHRLVSMVNLTRIYTRTGDKGATRLADNSEARKTDARVEAYGTVDEANAAIALALALGGLPPRVEEMLDWCARDVRRGRGPGHSPGQRPALSRSRIEQSSVERIEKWCDELSEGLPHLRSFILPGGSPAGPSCTWQEPCAGGRRGWPGTASNCSEPTRRPTADTVA